MRPNSGREFLNRLPLHGLKLFYEDVFELEQTRRAYPFTVAFAAVVLKGYRAGLGDSRQLRVLDDGLAVQNNCYPVASHRYLEAIPLNV